MDSEDGYWRIPKVASEYIVNMANGMFPDTASGDQLDRIAWSVANQEFRTATGTVRHEECKHKWKYYYGFTDSFEYCSKCDIKKP